MNIITQIARILVGCLFIFSGFIKANDTIGFSYKLTEYFEVFGTHFMVPLSTFLAIFICIFEMVLGFMLLIGTRIKLTLWLSLLMILFFTFLTFYSAYYDKVTSCGCFGDFLPLTPWQSFYKDVALLVLIIFLFIGKSNINELFGPKLEKAFMLLVIIASTVFPLYTFNFLPIFDFRPYKIGTDLYASIHPQVKYFYLLKNKATGEQKEFDTWPPNWDKEWDYVSNRTEPLDKSITPIIGFSIQNERGEEYADEFLQKEGYKFILVEYDLNKSKSSVQGQINDFAAMCQNEKIEFIALTSSDSIQIANFKLEHAITYPFYRNADDVPLKTMIRSNPGLILINKSTVVAMWHHNSLPAFSDVKKQYLAK